MSTNIISVQDLSHKYSNSWAIKDISFEMNKAGIMGLLGSNGAGKSTTMNIICGVLNQTAGNVIINGIDLKKKPKEAKKEIGFLPQQIPLYMEMTVHEYLHYTAHLREMDIKIIPTAVENVKEKCGIAHFSNRLIKNLSGGYRQRVGIAQAIIHQPKLVVLDEPTNGLDPNQIIEVRSLIKEIAQERAVIFSSHVLSEVQLLCKEIRMIEQGRIIFSDTMEAFNNYLAPQTVSAVMLQPPSKEELMKIAGIKDVKFLTSTNLLIKYEENTMITDRIIKKSVDNDWQLMEIFLEKASLDDIFAQLSNQVKAN